MKHVTIIGCGDIGQRVAKLWQDRNVKVFGTTRSEESAQWLAGQHITPVLLNLDTPKNTNPVPSANALVYYFVPPPGHGTHDPRMENFIALLEQADVKPTRIVAISTSGVYGDQGGGRVTEDSPPAPQTDRGRRRLAGETRLREWGRTHDVAVIILRVGGIYAPDRLPLKRLYEKAPVLHEHLAPRTNRIHADDLASVCMAAADNGHPDQIYNVCDGQDSNMTEYFNTIADCLGLPRPPCVDWQQAEEIMGPGMLSYLKESRHMDNRRMREELGITLRYPDLRTALTDALKDNT
jgi:nucleoside-diphosphate-sugar epimerase